MPKTDERAADRWHPPLRLDWCQSSPPFSTGVNDSAGIFETDHGNPPAKDPAVNSVANQ